jgi:hypothetical protein
MEKKLFFIFGLFAGIIVTLIPIGLFIDKEFPFDWNLFVFFALVLSMITYVLKRKYIDDYCLKDDEIDKGEFNFITGEMFVDYNEAKREKENNTRLKLNLINEEQNRFKDFVLLKFRYDYFKIKQALDCGKEAGYEEADLADLIAFKKVIKKPKGLFNVIETRDTSYMHSQGALVKNKKEENPIKEKKKIVKKP